MEKIYFRDVYIRGNQTIPNLAPNNFPTPPRGKKKWLCRNLNAIKKKQKNKLYQCLPEELKLLQVDLRTQNKPLSQR